MDAPAPRSCHQAWGFWGKRTGARRQADAPEAEAAWRPCECYQLHMPTVPLQPSLAWGCLWEDPCCPQPRSQEVLPVAWLRWPTFHGHPGKPFLVLRHLSQIEFRSQPPPQEAPSWLLHRLGSACQLLPAGPPSALFWLVCVYKLSDPIPSPSYWPFKALMNLTSSRKPPGSLLVRDPSSPRWSSPSRPSTFSLTGRFCVFMGADVGLIDPQL